ncbi:MAG: tetratricopeptide repeat protein [Bryobacterales bacterium]|nr:tetratricopeptide repeat protein [Bryobacterales bacterium]
MRIDCARIVAMLIAVGVAVPESGGQPVLLEMPALEETEREDPADGELHEGEPVILPTDVPPTFEVDTLAGKKTVTGFEVEPISQVYGLVLADSLLQSDWPRIEAELGGLRKGLGRRARLMLAIASGSELRIRGPFQTSEQLRREIRAARPPEPESAPEAGASVPTEGAPAPETPALEEDRADGDAEASPIAIDEVRQTPAQAREQAAIAALRLYQQIGEAAAVLGCDWPALLVVGRLPDLRGALALPTAAYLTDRMRAYRLRFSYMPLDRLAIPAADLASFVTGGTVVGNVSGFLQHFELESRFIEVGWDDPVPREGYHFHSARIRDTATGRTWTAPSVSPGWRVPRLTALVDFFPRVTDVAKAVVADSADSVWIEAKFETLEAINPSDEALLEAQIRFGRRNGDWESLAVAWRRLSEIRPADPGAFSSLGSVLVRLQRWADAEPAFARLRELRPEDPQAAEALGRVHERMGNHWRALELFDESLAIDPSNQALWFLKADTARRSGATDVVLEALEKGVQLPSPPHARRAELIRLYLETGQTEEASDQIELGADQAGADSAPLGVYAQFWEEIGRPEEALALWERAAGADPASEPAASASARLHFSLGRPERANAIAEPAVRRFPDSARLHLTLARSLEALHRHYELRAVLHAGVESVPSDLELLAYRARVEDTFGDGAPAAYRALAERLSPGNDGDELEAVLERGFKVALRHEDMAEARWFADMASGRNLPLADLLPAEAGDEAEEVAVLGGTRALAYFANANASAAPATFFREYCRPVVYAASRSKQVHEQLTRRFGLYFETIRKLWALRDASAEHEAKITLSVEDRPSLRKTRKVLGLLGWRLKSGKSGYSLQPIESEAGAERQEIGSALQIDEIAIQESLRTTQPYILRIRSDSVPLVLGKDVWRSELYPGEALAGGFAEAVIRDPRIGAAYIGISQMHAGAARAVVESVGLKRLVTRYSNVLLMHGSSLSVENGVADVPGGVDAHSLWTNLVGASPRDPDRFLPRLLRKEEGRLLGYYSALGQLDDARRRFFTQSAVRMGRFFELYKTAPEFREGGRMKVRQSPYLELLRELPMDTDGKVVLPGGAEIWMVAKGEADASRLARRIRRKVVPDVEDEILVRLARTKFQTPTGPRSQVDKFLATACLDLMRSEAMDGMTALNFAQLFGQYESAFPYFATLSGMQSEHVRRFLSFARSLEQLDAIGRNRILALFHSLTEILCLAQLEGHLSEETAADLFGAMCLRLSRASDATAASDAALETVEGILAANVRSKLAGDADHLIRMALNVESDDLRREEFTQVLRLQRVPTLSSLLQVRDATLALASGTDSRTGPLDSLDAGIRSIPVVATTNAMGFRDEEKRLIMGFGLLEAKQVHNRLSRAAARRKVRLPELQRLGANLRGKLLPQVGVALAGIVYAYYLRPDDLPIAEDPLFLRKHKFYKFSTEFQRNFFPRGVLSGIGEDTGPFVMGGFADFADTAGHVAKFRMRSIDHDAQALVRVQLGSLRSTQWQELRDTDMRRFAMTALLGREQVVSAATDYEARSVLLHAAAGLLSVSRTRQLLASLASRSWGDTWTLLSLADLYQIGLAVSLDPTSSESTDSPVAKALQSLPSIPDARRRMDLVGSIRPRTYGYSRPRIWTDPPYEEYERYMSDTAMAERAAELKLYLIRAADARSLPVERLARVAEQVARRVLSMVDMGDFWDWRSVLETFDQATGLVLDEVLAQ